MRKNDLKRDKGIKKRLEREFQVERPPESYFQAVQDAFDSLPDELPVKVRPLPQRVLRTCAALAACLVLVAVGAFGLNLVSPGLMESMPGVGQIFQELNQTNVEPTPQPEDPSSLAEVQEDLPAVPPFEPVTFPLRQREQHPDGGERLERRPVPAPGPASGDLGGALRRERRPRLSQPLPDPL